MSLWHLILAKWLPATLLLAILGPSQATAAFPFAKFVSALGSKQDSSVSETHSLYSLQPAIFGSSARPIFGEAQGDQCPFPYHRLTVADIETGLVPYLFGGNRRPCNSCRTGDIAEFCQFHRPDQDTHRRFQHTAHICSRQQQSRIISWALEMGFTELLEFTPCDLWPALQGRTLWIVGDSQVRQRGLQYYESLPS